MPLGSKIVAAAIAIPVQSFVHKRLTDAWRKSTGTEPPSSKTQKELKKLNKQAIKEGGEPIPLVQPAFTDALMWSALSAMSIILVRFVAERGAEEVHRWTTGRNLPAADRKATYLATKSGEEAGALTLKNTRS